MNKMPTIPQLRQLIGNPEVYAVQLAEGKGYAPVRQPLTNMVLKHHLDGEMTVGTYVNWGDQARTLIFDIDNTEYSNVETICAALWDLGVPSRSVGIEFSGSKGHHVWVVMAGFVSASLLRRLGRAALGLSQVDCEVFPKQDKAHDLGNLCKLPGGIHTGSKKRATMLTAWPSPMGKSMLEKILDKLPKETLRTSNGGEGMVVRECVAAIEAGPGTGWRNHGLFQLATLAHREGWSDETVELVVRRAYEKMDHDDFTEQELTALLESAKRSGPICSTLPREVQCTDCPVRRAKGLYTKPGQLKHGAEGELAVVEIGKRRKDGSVELIHPDLSFGLVAPK